MIVNSLRILAVVILFAVILVHDIPFKKMYKDAFMQFYLAVLCILILMAVDNITGFVITLALLIVYFRIYNAEIKEKNRIKLEEMQKEEAKEEAKEAAKEAAKKCDKKDDSCKLENPEKNSIVLKEINNINDEGFKPYITDQHLFAAQNNVIDDSNYNNEIGDLTVEHKNVRPLYKSQGLNDGDLHVGGYDNYNSYYGSLQFKPLHN
jgi:Ca2+/Na+ antiporter